MKFPSFYFPWLQKGNPTGAVDQYPALSGYESSVPGIYCVGDLTGVPLIKLAAESGYGIVEELHADGAFGDEAHANADSAVYDLVIVGAGPAGMAAGLRAAELGYRAVVIESAQMFNTIVNFPKGKPIYVTPVEPPMESALAFGDGTKETLLEELNSRIADKSVTAHMGETVEQIDGRIGAFEVKTTSQTYKALRVIVAIGKSGNARQLDVPGEALPKVSTRLIDPGAHRNQDVLVVGGGDSAVEAAVALADAGNRVTLSYRKPSLSRPKEQNLAAFVEAVEDGRIRPLFESTVKEILERDVVLSVAGGEEVIPNDAVYALIGTEIPVAFFKRSRIKMAGERDGAWWIGLIAMLSFFTMLYFGKSGRAINIFAGSGNPVTAMGAYLTAPWRAGLTWSAAGQSWYGSLNFLLGWLGSLVFLVSGGAMLWIMARDWDRCFGSAWKKIKYGYFIGVGLTFFKVYVQSQLMQDAGWVEAPTYYYSLLYTVTILLFGIRRMQRTPTPYIIAQTSCLIIIQALFLFVIPFFLYDRFIAGSLSDALRQQLFPSGKWSSFAFILFWPLNINEFGNSAFWTWFPFVQTFGILFLLVYLWGKGAYCGWICSCGAMAETLGDEYRTLAPHGPRAKRMDNIGQVVLWAALACGLLYMPYKLCHKVDPACAIPTTASTLWYGYKLVIDVFFAGVLGLGVYFFYGGRIWCRYGCPLAALMHVYARFSRYRIMANKKRCISCNICTKVCHMGIDVMGYACRGIPMNDVECVRCSACVVNCPMQVLTFGAVGHSDPDNKACRKSHIPLCRNWSSGLPTAQLRERLEDESKQHPEVLT